MINHTELINRAERWLRNSKRCGVVLTECSGAITSEIPDAIGWRCMGGESILVECKMSRADFKADQKKIFRTFSDISLGTYKYYLTPPKMLQINEIPKGWGLLELHGRCIREIIKAEPCKLNALRYRYEIGVLWSELRKYQIALNGDYLLPSKAMRRITNNLNALKAKGV